MFYNLQFRQLVSWEPVQDQYNRIQTSFHQCRLLLLLFFR
jgi:hypothetical protein